MGRIVLTDIRKSYGPVEVLKGIDLTIEEGEFAVFVGPSGCGKSTLLRMIAGLDRPTAGRVEIDGTDVTDRGAADRGLAMVFQSYALYPHMTVRANLAFGLQNTRMDRAEIDSRIAEAARMLEIGPLLDRRPGQLSGGQRQRVAIGRAIVRRPTAFLLDEPLSNLDAELRVSMRAELSALHDRLAATMIHVTHDQVEAMTMADRIVVLRAGRVEQVDSPLDLFNRPANLFVAGFIGAPGMNLWPVTVQAGDEEGQAALPGGQTIGLGRPGEGVVMPGQREGAVTVGQREGVVMPGQREGVVMPGQREGVVTVGLRPQHLRLDAAGPVAAQVTLVEALGAESVVHATLQHSDARLLAVVPGQPQLARGETVRFSFDPADLHLFDAAGRRLARV